MKISYFSRLLIISVLALATNASPAQDEEELSLEDGTIDSQVEYLIKESNNYQSYEVIPRDWMEKFRQNVNDTLQGLQTELSNLKAQISDQQSTIEELRGNLSETQASLDETRAAKDSMEFAGSVPMEKGLYRVVMWSIISILLLLLIVFIYRFNKSNRVTRQVRGKLNEIQDEMDQQKKRALEREQKLSRELQDERNKNRKG